MTDTETEPLVRRADAVEYDTVDAAEGMRKGVLDGEYVVGIGDEEHTPFLRRSDALLNR